MQPTYLPWCGYFALMQEVDIFVFLDSVQFAKRSWQQRNQIKSPNGPHWLSVPVVSKGKRDQLINEVEIDKTSNFATTHRKTIEANFARAKFFKVFSQELLSSIDTNQTNLAELNIGIIKICCGLLGIKTPIVRSSSLHGRGVKAELLASLCLEIGATEYVSPPSSKPYLSESSIFDQIGVPVRYFDFNHPVYPQLFGDFLPYMSVIDLLFNCGDESSKFLKKGVLV